MTRAVSECRRGLGARRLRLGGSFVVLLSGLMSCAGAALAQAPAQGQIPALEAAPVVQPTSPDPVFPPVEPGASVEPAAPAEPIPAAAKPSIQPDAFLPSALPHDLSPWGMFRNADRLVQIVMVGLAFASVVTWTVWLAKTIELWSAKRSARRGLQALAGASSLREASKDLGSDRSPVALLVAAAVGEADRSEGLESEGVKERAAVLLSRIEAQAGRSMTRGTGSLATIGATAPFVGLFGTVWGIMNSFIGISQTNTTNLAVVAPGIAEALLATALGLVAAIPAVVIYNVFARSISGYRAMLADATAEVLRHMSRDLDREALPRHVGDSHVVPIRQLAE